MKIILGSCVVLVTMIGVYFSLPDTPKQKEIPPVVIETSEPVSVAGISVVIDGQPPEDTMTDTDMDGLTDDSERYWGTDIALKDTDGDGYNDGDEILNGYSPLNANPVKLRDNDSDNDRINDAWENLLKTSPLRKDSDGDGFTDSEEIFSGHQPLSQATSTVEKKITVSIAKQELSYYFDTVKLDTFPISTGVKGWPTPIGTFKILDKQPTKYYVGPGYGFPNTKWNLQFTTWRGYRYWIHGAYWHDNFGKPMSHGCVNVSYKNMEDLYDWADKNTTVVIE